MPFLDLNHAVIHIISFHLLLLLCTYFRCKKSMAEVPIQFYIMRCVYQCMLLKKEALQYTFTVNGMNGLICVSQHFLKIAIRFVGKQFSRRLVVVQHTSRLRSKTTMLRIVFYASLIACYTMRLHSFIRGYEARE